jgi:hypothetical protein
MKSQILISLQEAQLARPKGGLSSIPLLHSGPHGNGVCVAGDWDTCFPTLSHLGLSGLSQERRSRCQSSKKGRVGYRELGLPEP